MPHSGKNIDARPCFIEVACASGAVLALCNGVFERRAEPTVFSSVDEGKRAFSRIGPPDTRDKPKPPFSIRLVVDDHGSSRVVRERHFAEPG